MAVRVDVPILVEQVLEFVERCRLEPDGWRFASAPGGPETLYASSFACMIYHYVGQLEQLTAEQRREWATYLKGWQEPESGYFIGPELVQGELRSRKHSYEHIRQHLAATLLPALALLGASPTYPLTFAHPFMERPFLQRWLAGRDWRDAWLEGNNLLFVGQFLIHLRDVEGEAAAPAALDCYFDWLDGEVDPATGLWGSDGYCSAATALYGGYHQLLVYYHEGRPIRYPERLIDTALALQHEDGGFNPGGGGGACEDTDAIDILVNLYKRVDYRRPEIRLALRKALRHILAMQMADGGFIYRRDRPFVMLGIERSAAPANVSNLFSTWFRLHTLALMAEILTDEPVASWAWRFNDSCSMGWHAPWDREAHALGWRQRQEEQWQQLGARVAHYRRTIPGRARRIGGRLKRRLQGGISHV